MLTKEMLKENDRLLVLDVYSGQCSLELENYIRTNVTKAYEDTNGEEHFYKLYSVPGCHPDEVPESIRKEYKVLYDYMGKVNAVWCRFL